MILGLLTVGFAFGFPIGQQRGFNTASEWGIVQANNAALQVGSPLIVLLESGQTRDHHAAPGFLQMDTAADRA